jgi:hypothetical protein
VTYAAALGPFIGRAKKLMDVSPCTLADCSVAPDGNEVHLNLFDAQGVPVALRFSLEQIGSLAMTLPTLLERAIRARYQDDRLRYVYTLGNWTIEAASNPDVVILNLSTKDGFSASFGVARWMLGRLAEALGEQQEATPPPPELRPN